MTEFYRQLGERLRVTRKTLGVSEQEAAEAACVTVRTYRKWEKGGQVQNGDPDPLRSFCDEFDVSLDWLTSGEGKFLADTEEEYELRARKIIKGILTDAGQPFTIFSRLTKH